jgi:hypothetical protein
MTEQREEAIPTAPEPVADPDGTGPAAAASGPEQPVANPYAFASEAPGFGAPPAAAPHPLKRFLVPVISIAVVGGLALGGKIMQDHNSSHRDGTGSISKKGDLDAFQIKPGDCFQYPGAGSDIKTVTAIPCADAHTAQVFADIDFPNATDTAPSTQALQDTMGPLCKQAAADKLDVDKVSEDAKLSYFFPQDDAWAKGHHDILCILHEATPATGSGLK